MSKRQKVSPSHVDHVSTTTIQGNVIQPKDLDELRNNNDTVKQRLQCSFDSSVSVDTVKQSLKSIAQYIKQLSNLIDILTVTAELFPLIHTNDTANDVLCKVVARKISSNNCELINATCSDNDSLALLFQCYNNYGTLQRTLIQHLNVKLNNTGDESLSSIIQSIHLITSLTIHTVSAQYNAEAVTQLLQMLYTVHEKLDAACVHRSKVLYNIDCITMLTVVLLRSNAMYSILNTLKQLHTLLTDTQYNTLSNMNLPVVRLLLNALTQIPSTSISSTLNSTLQQTIDKYIDYNTSSRRCIPSQAVYDQLQQTTIQLPHIIPMSQLLATISQSSNDKTISKSGSKSATQPLQSSDADSNPVNKQLREQHQSIQRAEKLAQLQKNWSTIQQIPIATTIQILSDSTVMFNVGITAAQFNERKTTVTRLNKLQRAMTTENQPRYTMFKITAMPNHKHKFDKKQSQHLSLTPNQLFYLTDLPIDTLTHTFTYLHPADLIALSTTNKTIRHIATHNDTWYHIIVRTFGPIEDIRCKHIQNNKPHNYMQLYKKRVTSYVYTISKRFGAVFMCCMCKCSATYETIQAVQAHQTTHKLYPIKQAQSPTMQRNFELSAKQVKTITVENPATPAKRKYVRSSDKTDQPLKCTFDGCNNIFATKYYLNKHLQQHYDAMNVPIFKCQQCNIDFPSKYKLHKHIDKCHNDNNTVSSADKPAKRKYKKRKAESNVDTDTTVTTESAVST